MTLRLRGLLVDGCSGFFVSGALLLVSAVAMTSTLNYSVRVGMDVRWDGATMGLDDMINEGVRRAYNLPENVLRASITVMSRAPLQGNIQ